ncbi:hypothetical protein GN958_ATG02013 [Phytophthora infestans]|uniref:FHA domain-containing protein n=1 Tax=Phytophthora infestans TaxID=4787 RepID=A0A8S9V6U6_PHYIN|nr:hypothetical protein GN958_ATG02013 [Phytophthora infestans]
MPFLRSLEVDSSHELRSSKTLIGSNAPTCDVVISGDNILELHALLNLSADKASAKLVPFSATAAGVCYVNDVVVLKEGTVVVHGDRLAFGNPHNVFLFELTPHPQVTALPQRSVEKSEEHSVDQTSSTTGNRAFRKALDTLRGDRRDCTPHASVSASIQNNLLSTRNQSSISSYADSTAPSLMSKGQLSKFLVEASSDSLLSDYVERKLSQRRSRQSSLANSNHIERTRQNKTSSSSVHVRQSRKQRNFAEVEKLRLSQRIREVNDVLNGDMEFQESYLSPFSKRSRRQSLNRTPSDVDRSDDDSEDDEDDELPVMIERVKPQTPANLSASIQTEHSDQENILNPDEAEERSDQLDYSLESEATSSQTYNPPKARSFLSKAMELGFNDLTRSHSRPINTARQEAAKTALQEELIKQAIRRKKNEIISETFVRWVRGLRIQSRNRERTARQLDEVRTALGKLRRDQYFIRWRDFAALINQVLMCRLEAFQQRREWRLVRKCWSSLRLSILSTRQRSMLLRGLVIKKAVLKNHDAFRRWQQFVLKCSTRNQLGDVQRAERLKLDAHLERMSERHYNHRIVQPLLTQILRQWKMTADRLQKQRQILRRVLVHGTSKLTQRALRKWIEVTMISRYSLDLKKRTEQEIKRTTDRLTSQHDQAQLSLQESNTQQLQKLMVAIEKKDRELEQLKRQQRAEALEKTAAKKKMETDLHKFFESAIVKCDDRIAQASDQLEELLRNAENNVLGARFSAAHFLVDSILQQKIHIANESTRFQEAVQPYVKYSPADDPMSELSSNGRFLYDMIQQVRDLLFSSFPPLHLSCCFYCFSATHTSSAASSLVGKTCSSFRRVGHLARLRTSSP